jgi:DNA-directed RNA polymerase subunit M/transcription elongation factor TFIIS
MNDQVHCPQCDRLLAVPEDLIGAMVRCPQCATAFTADPTAPRPANPSAADAIQKEATERRQENYAEELPPSRKRRPPEKEWDEEDEEEYREYDMQRRKADAKAQVAGPATALIVVSAIVLGLSILMLFLYVFAGAAMVALLADKRMEGDNQEGMMERTVIGIAQSIMQIVLNGLVLAGALKMKRLRSHGLAMTSSILAMIPCTGCCLLGLPFGIWALVVINRPEVRGEFS